jgi:hypothetical protein
MTSHGRERAANHGFTTRKISPQLLLADQSLTIRYCRYYPFTIRLLLDHNLRPAKVNVQTPREIITRANALILLMQCIDEWQGFQCQNSAPSCTKISPVMIESAACLAAGDILEQHFGVRCLTLMLADPKFYQLDTAF